MDTQQWDLLKMSADVANKDLHDKRKQLRKRLQSPFKAVSHGGITQAIPKQNKKATCCQTKKVCTEFGCNMRVPCMPRILFETDPCRWRSVIRQGVF